MILELRLSFYICRLSFIVTDTVFSFCNNGGKPMRPLNTDAVTMAMPLPSMAPPITSRG
jgi:hypothetical protein